MRWELTFRPLQESQRNSCSWRMDPCRNNDAHPPLADSKHVYNVETTAASFSSVEGKDWNEAGIRRLFGSQFV